MDMKFILAISTSSGIARVAAVNESSRVLFQFEITDYKSQSVHLLPTIHERFHELNLQASQVVAIAVDVGPGGFTSLRTACGVAQGLAIAWQVPTVPLTSFECMSTAGGQPAVSTVLIDARLNELYVATLQATDHGTQWLRPAGLLAVDCLPDLKSDFEGCLVCDPSALPIVRDASFTPLPGEVSAVRLAELAWRELQAGRAVKPLDCQPLYVRDKVAQTTSERLALKHGSI